MFSNVCSGFSQSEFDNTQLSHSTIVPDSLHTGWYFFELESFEVEEDSDLEFEFCDIENPYWKSNIKFNSVELTKQQVDKVETEETSVTGETIKYPVAEAEDFGHLGNPDYVVTEWNESFQQNIVVVRNVCWLRFIKRFPLCSKGRYRVRLHMYLGADSNWPQTSDDHRTYVRIKKVVEAGATTLAEENMSSNIWNAVIRSYFDNSQLAHSTIVPDSLHTDGYVFERESHKVEKDSDLKFEFCDIENPYWKSNIKFNSVELKKQQVDKVETEETSVTGETIKYPVAEAEDFGHFGNPNYVVTEWNESFQQNIVVVRNVCWLRFVKRFPLCSKGRYCVRLHMYLGADSNWPQTSDDHRTYVRIKKVLEAGATTLTEENMSSNIWDAVIRSYFDNSQLAHSTIVPDSLHTGWYFFELESFEVEEDSDLEFEFCDIENPYWKCNIKFNSVELMK